MLAVGKENFRVHGCRGRSQCEYPPRSHQWTRCPPHPQPRRTNGMGGDTSELGRGALAGGSGAAFTETVKRVIKPPSVAIIPRNSASIKIVGLILSGQNDKT